jgi:alcohol dehydrogenase class IV
VKVSLRHPLMLPRLALVDPELTYDLPPEMTATTGLDALTQLIEPYVCLKANPMVDGLCIEGMRRVARSLRVAVESGRDAAAREDMAVASLFGGLALANAGLGAVHGLAGPIGGAFPAPHGAVCAALLPVVTAMNLRALRGRMPQSDALRRYDEVGRIVTGRAGATADDLVQWLRDLVSVLNIPPLSGYGVSRDDFPAQIAAAQKASSMKANPIALSTEELGEILQAAR